ncbi:hypothetical protein NDU88_006288 [Pleurodeles waltl]|uniref:Uncharacterized protein n=1 Tax=Pleurodeles waltl TaxID=8319 RepID=A0AAV7UKJ8_PLEWA|nr:hypothetical protein NDU88_006288 [Pleurodeles waltl]
MACVNIRKCEVVGGDIQSGTVLSLKSGEGDGSKRPMCEVLVEGKKLVLMADSGSPWTIIVQDYFERMFEGIWDMTDLNESDIVAESFEGYMTDEFGSIKEEVWKDCEKNDDVIQEVKGYVRDGWPVKCKVAAELEPFAKVRGELEVENEMLFKKGKCIPPRGGRSGFGKEIARPVESGENGSGYELLDPAEASEETPEEGGKCVLTWDTERCNGMEGSWNVGGRLVTALWLGFPKKEEGFLLYPD